MDLVTPPKSDASGRVIALDADTVAILDEREAAQWTERGACGEAKWSDTGLVFTNPDGTALHLAQVTDRFGDLIAETGLPPIHLKDLRHFAATYTQLFGEVDHALADAVADLMREARVGSVADPVSACVSVGCARWML